MKRIILIILALTLVVISCKKKDDEVTGPGGGSNSGPAAITPQPDKEGTFEYQVKGKTFVKGADGSGDTAREAVFDAQGILKSPTWYDPEGEDKLIVYKCIYSDPEKAVYYGQMEFEEDGIKDTMGFVEGFKIIEDGTKLNMTNPAEGKASKDDIDWSYLYTFTLKAN